MRASVTDSSSWMSPSGTPSSVADVSGDNGLGELGLVEVREHGVDGVAEVDAGVDEGAVEVESDETRCAR